MRIAIVLLCLLISTTNAGNTVTGLGDTCAAHFAPYLNNYNYTVNPLSCLLFVYTSVSFVTGLT
jgi:hypothetical protein